MRGRRLHIAWFSLATALLAASMLWPGQAFTQTLPGTRILNEARATFEYKTGQKDSLRSNRTETVVKPTRSTASSIGIDLSPDAIVGNGVDSSTVTATVLDASGNAVPDGAFVTFVASSGTFPGGKDSITLPTVNGIVSVSVTSALVSQQIVHARIAATTVGVNSVELSASSTVLYFPGAVTGSVASAFSGRPVAGAIVVATDEAQSVTGRDTTGDDGKYLVPLSKAGLYTHTVVYQNRFGDQVQAMFQEMLPIPAQGGIPPTNTLNVISGNIIDRTTGMPVREAGIHVSLKSSGPMKSAGGHSLPMYETTDSRGTFQFDSLNPGTYDINVEDPRYAGMIVVSDTLPSSFLVDVALGISSETLAFDVVKSASKRIAEIGDAVAYMLDISNKSATASLTGIRIMDDLPLGFAYVNGSSRHERVTIADPTGYSHLEWVLTDTLAPGQSTRLTYMTTIGSGAMDGDGINHAHGVAMSLTGDTVASPVTSVAVVVRPGIFTDHGIIIGKVYFEENENGTQEYGEAGIAGVELWMEDGTHIMTGDDGKYSLPDVRPGQHVIRIDRRTLPAGSRVLATGTESAGDGATRFIRLVEGGVARADFHIRPPRQASLELTVRAPGPSARLQASFVIRHDARTLPSAMVLVDTLPKGLAYDMQSLMLNGSAVPGLTGQSRALHLELPVGQVDSLDTVTVFIVRDSSFSKRVGVARPKLVLSYPQRRDAVFRTVETFAIPGDHGLGSLAPRGASNEASLGAERKGQKGSE